MRLSSRSIVPLVNADHMNVCILYGLGHGTSKMYHMIAIVIHRMATLTIAMGLLRSSSSSSGG